MKDVKMKSGIARKRTDYIVLGITLLVFGYFAFFCETQELGDSSQYLNQLVSRELVYAWLLKGFTGLFGESYGFPLVIFQNILAVIAIYWLYVRLTNLFKFPILFEWVAFGALLAPHLITPLASRSGMIITNSVMTEGITLSLYYIWMGMLLTFVLERYPEKQNRRTVLNGVLAFVLAMTRGQFLICVVVWFLAGVFVFVLQKDYRKIVFLVLGCLLILVGKSVLTKAYHYVESGLYVSTTSGQPMMLANILFLSDLEDGANIENERLRIAYENMVRLVEEQKLSIRHISGNIIEIARFHEDGHETINFEIIDPQIEAVVGEVDGITTQDYEHLLVIIDEYASEIIRDVLPNILPEFIQNYFVIASLGFVRSIAIDRSVLPVYALVMYVVAIGLVFILLRHNRKSEGAYFMLLTLLLICGNVFGTSLMIQCISRYMIYNLPFFYIAGMAMLVEFVSGRKGKIENGI